MYSVVVVWNKDGDYFQTWSSTDSMGGIDHGIRVASQIGGTYCVVECPKSPQPNSPPP